MAELVTELGIPAIKVGAVNSLLITLPLNLLTEKIDATLLHP